MKTFRNILACALVLSAAAFAAPEAIAQGNPSGGVTVIGINRNRAEMDFMQAWADIVDSMTANYINYQYGLAVTDDPMIASLDTDARCANFTTTKLAGQTATNSTDAQKLAKATEILNMLKYNSPSSGGLVASRPPVVTGWADMYAHLPRDSNGRRLLQLIYVDGSSATFTLYLPGGSGADPINVTVTGIYDIKNPSQTTGGSTTPTTCPRNG